MTGGPAAAAPQIDLQAPVQDLPELSLSLDEHSFRHQDMAVTVTAVLPGRQVLALLPDDRKRTVEAFFRQMPEEERGRVRAVCVDLSGHLAQAPPQRLAPGPGSRRLLPRHPGRQPQGGRGPADRTGGPPPQNPHMSPAQKPGTPDPQASRGVEVHLPAIPYPGPLPLRERTAAGLLPRAQPRPRPRPPGAPPLGPPARRRCRARPLGSYPPRLEDPAAQLPPPPRHQRLHRGHLHKIKLLKRPSYWFRTCHTYVPVGFSERSGSSCSDLRVGVRRGLGTAALSRAQAPQPSNARILRRPYLGRTREGLAAVRGSACRGCPGSPDRVGAAVCRRRDSWGRTWRSPAGLAGRSKDRGPLHALPAGRRAVGAHGGRWVG